MQTIHNKDQPANEPLTTALLKESNSCRLPKLTDALLGENLPCVGDAQDLNSVILKYKLS